VIQLSLMRARDFRLGSQRISVSAFWRIAESWFGRDWISWLLWEWRLVQCLSSYNHKTNVY
jgi:hypothetical protein